MEEISYKPIIGDMTWSYSRIKTFEFCPYQWYLKYISYPKLSGQEMYFANYGKFLHDLLADFFSGDSSKEDLKVQYLTTFHENVVGRPPNQRVFQNFFSDGLECMNRLELSGNSVISVEEKVNFSVGEHPFVGFIDLIEQTKQGEFLIIDHKSRALSPRSKRKKPTKSDGELDEYLKQLYLYAVPVQEKYQKLPSTLSFHCYRKGTMIEEPFSEEVFEETKAWVVKCIEEIREETEFMPRPEYFKCRYLCEMREHCEFFE